MTACAIPLPPATITDGEFDDFRILILRESGIALGDSKRALLMGRLGRRMRELAIDSYARYYRLVLADGAELVRMLDAITTNETHFFREPRQFELLGNEICTGWERDAEAGNRMRRLRIWSAACSTGQEPWSLAMMLHDRMGPLGWHIDITASDLSTKVLEQAKAASWPAEKLGGIPLPMRARHVPRGTINPALRPMVRFDRINLVEPPFPFAHGFDAIFCRNVLIYFDRPTREKVIGNLLEHLLPGGYLFLGHAESLTGTKHQLKAVMPAVYRG